MDDPTVAPKNTSYPDPSKPPANAPKWYTPQRYDLKKLLPLVTAGLVVILLAEVAINYFEHKTGYKPVSEIIGQKTLNKSDLNGFPVYPQSVYVTKKKQPGSISYVWTSADDFDKISSWYETGKPPSGWTCLSQAGKYNSARSATGKISCKKNELVYDVYIYSHTTKTELVVSVPDRK
jgi:hypothetical protein